MTKTRLSQKLARRFMNAQNKRFMSNLSFYYQGLIVYICAAFRRAVYLLMKWVLGPTVTFEIFVI
jgi:hypothetical protein